MVVAIRRAASGHEIREASEIIWSEIYDDVSRDIIFDWLEHEVRPGRYCQWFVAVEEKQVVGALVWVLDDFYGNVASPHLFFIAVAQSHRRRGIGTKLVAESLPQLLHSFCGLRLGAVHVNTDGYNDEAMEFYRKLGPFHEARVPGFWGKEDDRITFFFQPEDITDSRKVP